jgi:L-histidine N-alpha-methyltransferase
MPAPDVTLDVHLHPEDLEQALRRDVRAGLSRRPRSLPPKWFYDHAGSVLFEEITRLPEYYPTRREREILEQRAGTIAAFGADTLVELGSGSSEKTRILLEAHEARGGTLRYVPFDVSEDFLRQSAATIAADHPDLSVHAVVGDFEHHLSLLPQGGRRLVAFLGGTIGNLDPPAREQFLTDLRNGLAPGDGLLLGTDLVKDPERLVRAYDDSAGVTAAFNKNVLHVINRELRADFDVERFTHRAVWNEHAEWIEMRLVSENAPTVTIRALDLVLEFTEGEEILTEISSKFRRAPLTDELSGAGFALEAWWTDAGGDFALSLSTAC